MLFSIGYPQLHEGSVVRSALRHHTHVLILYIIVSFLFPQEKQDLPTSRVCVPAFEFLISGLKSF